MEKLETLEKLKTIVNRLQSEGKKIVLANGIFDILHVGHIRYLQAAKSFGDILVVAVNSDFSTQLNKGPSRPVTNERERAEILNAIQFVDYIYLFNEKDLETIRYFFKTKGALKAV